jgi:signal transduction histidine kinase
MVEVSFIDMWNTIKGMCPALSINPNVKVVFEVSKNIPPIVLTDGGWLMQMTLNLVSNSCKYTLEGSVTVRCLALEQGLSSDKPVVRVEVRPRTLNL